MKDHHEVHEEHEEKKLVFQCKPSSSSVTSW